MKTFITLLFVIAFVSLSVGKPERRPRPPPPPTRVRRQNPPPSTVPVPAVTELPADFTPEEISAFNEWKEKFGVEYATEAEEIIAMAQMLKNKKKIDDHNKKFDEGEFTFRRALFKYSDLSRAEKKNYLTGLAVPPKEKEKVCLRSLPALPQFSQGPAYVNWVEKGLVGPVYDQGWCRSCWAFSASGIVDAVLRKRNITAEVSTQQIVDCSTKGCWGCSSGWPKYALDYVKANGIALSEKIPYLMEEDACVYTKDKFFSYINATYNIPTRGNETWLRDIVASVGPVSIVMCLQDSFYNYESGIYYQENCCNDIIHAMLLVGYGTDPVGGDYWLVKNTWGDSWGENGYIRVARNRNNMCNIAHYAVYAT